MKYTNHFLCFIFLLTSHFSISQNWFKEDAHWVYNYSQPFSVVGYEEVFFGGDTIVNNQTCKILNRIKTTVDYAGSLKDTMVSQNNPRIVFEKNDSVFIWNHWTSEFILIYDFTMLPGDSLSIPMEYFYCEPGDTMTYIIDEIDSINISGNIRKVQKATVWEFTVNFIEHEILIIEGIGIVFGRFEFDNGIIWEGNHGYLILPFTYPCLFDTEGWSFCSYGDFEIDEYNPESANCYYLPEPVSTKEIQKENNLTVFPNPANDVLHLHPNKHFSKDAEFYLFNQLGQEMLFEVLPKMKNKYTVSVADLPTGIYFFEIKMNGERVGVGQVVLN